MEECIFCKIVKGEIPKYVVHENEHAIAFLDIFPKAKGHTVVIPKNHAKVLTDSDATVMAGVMEAVQESMKKLETAIGAQGFTVGANQNEAAGQTIMHLHMHIMPRFEGDGGGTMHSVIDNPGDTRVEDIAKLLTT